MSTDTVSCDRTVLELAGISSTDMGYKVPGSGRTVPAYSKMPLPFLASMSIGSASGLGSGGTKIELDFGLGLIDGFRRCSSEISGGTDF